MLTVMILMYVLCIFRCDYILAVAFDFVFLFQVEAMRAITNDFDSDSCNRNYDGTFVFSSKGDAVRQAIEELSGISAYVSFGCTWICLLSIFTSSLVIL
jgi:hypothetical protein